MSETTSEAPDDFLSRMRSPENQSRVRAWVALEDDIREAIASFVIERGRQYGFYLNRMAPLAEASKHIAVLLSAKGRIIADRIDGAAAAIEKQLEHARRIKDPCEVRQVTWALMDNGFVANIPRPLSSRDDLP